MNPAHSGVLIFSDILINMAKFIIGIDIGGSKINAVLMKDGRVFHRVKSPTPKSKKEFLEKLYSAVDHLISAAGKENILGIGCGVGGALDISKGVILSWSNMKFLAGFNIKSWLKKKFHCEVKIDNDARSFTRGEYLFGAGKGYKNIVGLTLGTGVGGGAVINGRVIYGAHGSAGELGHMIIQIKNQKSKIKNYDLEALTVKYMRNSKFPLIAEAYKTAKDKKIKEALLYFEENLGAGLANIINILDPEAIIIGGGAAEAAKVFIPKIKKAADKFIVSPAARKNVKILTGKLGEDAGALGAAALFIENRI